MGNGFIAFLLGAGFAAWVYSKAMRQTGNNTQSALIAAGGAGFVAFLLMLLVLSMIPK